MSKDTQGLVIARMHAHGETHEVSNHRQKSRPPVVKQPDTESLRAPTPAPMLDVFTMAHFLGLGSSYFLAQSNS